MILKKFKLAGSLSDASFEFSFAAVIFFMKTMGIWPSPNTLFSSVRYLIFLIGVIFACINRVFAVITTPNRIEFLRAFMYLTIVFSILLKFMIYKCKKENLERLLIEVKYGLKQYTFVSQKNKIMITYFMNIGRFINLSFMTIVQLQVIYFDSTYVINFYDVEKIRNVGSAGIIYPWNLKNYSSYLIGLYFVELCITEISIIILVTVDSFLCIIILHVTVQVKVLNSDLESYNGQILNCARKYNNLKTCSCMKCIIEEHVRIIRLIDLAEDMFNIVLLIDFLRYFISCASSLYCVVKFYDSKNTSGSIEFMLYFFAISLSILQPCFLCHKMTESMNETGEIAYHIDWIHYNRKLSVYILLLILRSNKSVNITAGKFFPINRNTFKNIINTSISYASILLTLK